MASCGVVNRMSESEQGVVILDGLYTTSFREPAMSDQTMLFDGECPRPRRNRLSLQDDLTGQKFGRLTVVSRTENVGDHRGWLCECSCGGKTVASTQGLRHPTGGTKSCGCLRREVAKKRAGRPWNKGKTYAIQTGDGSERIYKTRHAWAQACRRVKGGSCELCGYSRATCDVHHVVSRASGGLNVISNSLVICPNCHREEHEAEIRSWHGADSRQVKLTDDDVRDIRASELPYKELAKRYSVSAPTISSVRRRLTWKHVS